MKKLIDISEEHLVGLKALSKNANRSVKKQLEFIIHNELYEVIAKRDPEIVKQRNLVIDQIHELVSKNGDKNKGFKFTVFCDNIAHYELNTKDFSYSIEVDNEEVLPKTKIGYIIYHNSLNEAYIEFKCKNKATKEEVVYSHGGYFLARKKLEDKGIIQD